MAKRACSGCVSAGRRSASKKGSHDSSSDAERLPMSLENLAALAARRLKGKSSSHPLAEQAGNILCASIKNMVYKLALKYSPTCKTDADDLAQECLRRVMLRIGDFNPRLARFTTWSWTVCRSVLNGAYRRHRGWNEHMVLGPEGDVSDCPGVMMPKSQPDMGGLVGEDIVETVRLLAKKHPSRRRLIMSIFGNPDRKGSVLPSNVLLHEAAKKEGITYSAVNAFFRAVVRPFFLQRFSDKAQVPEVRRPKVKGSKVVAAVLEVLREAGRPMWAKELYDAAVRKGLYVSSAENPYVSFLSVLGKAVLKGEKRVERVGAGVWRVFSDDPDVSSVPLPSKVKGSKVVDAALMALREAGRPMPPKEMYAAAVKGGFYVSSAGNPYVSFLSVLGKAVLKGEKRIGRAEDGFWRAVA